MNIVGIVALSVLGALFVFALLGGAGVLIWLAWSLKKQTAALQEKTASVYAETKELMATYQAELKSVVESAKAGFGAIRKDVQAQLEEHRRQMQSGIDKINAEALQGAAARSIQACLRLEKAIGVLQQMFLETETRSTHEFAPEEFAPEESTFGPPPTGYSVGTAAQLDQQADAEEQAGLFTETPAEV